MRRSDLWLSVRQRKLPCVIDPALALCHAQGPRLAQRLTQVVEPWLTRSFWQTIDASELLLHRAAARDAAKPSGSTYAPSTQPLPDALLEWMRLRETTDAGSWLFRWIGDCFAESQTQDAADADVVARYEALAESFAARVPACEATVAWPCRGFDAVAGAMDAVVLSATLDGAAVLSVLPAALAKPNTHDRPWPVQALERIGLDARELDILQPVFAAERALLREALALAGLAPLVEAMPPLVVVHALVDSGSEQPWNEGRVSWYRL